MMNTKEYAKTQLFSEIRLDGSLNRYVKQVKDTQPLDWRSAPADTDDRSSVRIIKTVTDYLHESFPGSLNVLEGESFTIDYNAVGDCDRPSVLGETTQGVCLTVMWEPAPIIVDFYNAPGISMLTKPGYIEAVESGQVNRKKLSEFSGWRFDDTRNLPEDQLSSLLSLMRMANSHSNRLVRLVKGALYYLDWLERGKRTIVTQTASGITYSTASVVQEAASGRSAYIYSSIPQSAKHSYVLTLMASAFPVASAQCASAVVIPEEAERLLIVGYGAQPYSQVDTEIIPSDIWAGVCAYASDMGITEMIEPALIIAASLHQNRYFGACQLPAVHSTGDLLQPMFTFRGASAHTIPDIGLSLMKSIGRLHQMITMVVVKDVISTAWYSTNAPGWQSNARDFLSRRGQAITTLAADYGPQCALMIGSAQMNVLSMLDTGAIDRLLRTPVLEGAWLFNESVKTSPRGTLAGLKHGSIDNMSGPFGVMPKFFEELNLAGVGTGSISLPQGRFCVLGAGLTPVIAEVSEPKVWHTMKRGTADMGQSAGTGRPPLATTPPTIPSASNAGPSEPSITDSPPRGRQERVDTTMYIPPSSPVPTPVEPDLPVVGVPVPPEEAAPLAVKEGKKVVVRSPTPSVPPVAARHAQEIQSAVPPPYSPSPQARHATVPGGPPPNEESSSSEDSSSDEEKEPAADAAKNEAAARLADRIQKGRKSFEKAANSGDDKKAQANELRSLIDIGWPASDVGALTTLFSTGTVSASAQVKWAKTDKAKQDKAIEIIGRKPFAEVKGVTSLKGLSVRLTNELLTVAATHFAKDGQLPGSVQQEIVRTLREHWGDWAQVESRVDKLYRSGKSSQAAPESGRSHSKTASQVSLPGAAAVNANRAAKICAAAGVAIDSKVGKTDVMAWVDSFIGAHHSDEVIINFLKWTARTTAKGTYVDVPWERIPYTPANPIPRKAHNSGHNYRWHPDDERLLRLSIASGSQILRPADYPLFVLEFELTREQRKALDAIYATKS